MQEVARQLEQLLVRARDYCDKPDDSAARRFQDAVRAAHGEAKQGKAPERLMYAVKDLIRMTESFKSNDEVYDFHHSDDLRDRCQDIEKLLQKLAR